MQELAAGAYCVCMLATGKHGCFGFAARSTTPALHLCPVGNGLCAIPILRCRVEHVFDEDAVAAGGIIDQNMGYRAYQFSVLYNR